MHDQAEASHGEDIGVQGSPDTEDPAAYCQTQEILRLAVPAENLMPRESQEVMVDGRTPMPNQASFVPSFSMVTTVVPLVTGTKGL